MYKPVDLQIQFLYHSFLKPSSHISGTLVVSGFFFIVTYNYLPWAHVDNLYGRISWDLFRTNLE